MGLAWQQGPLASGSVGHFLTGQPMPPRLLFAEPLRRRMRVRFADRWIADSEDVILLHESGRYPVAYFPVGDVEAGILTAENRITQHRDLGETQWFTVEVAEQRVDHSGWQHTALPPHAAVLGRRVAFAWRAMDAFYERRRAHRRACGRRLPPHRHSLHLTASGCPGRRAGDRRHEASAGALQSGFAPRWYVAREDIDEAALELVDLQTFCPYKGICSYYDIGGRQRAAWSYLSAWPEVGRVANLVSFEPDKIDVYLDGKQLQLEPGQTVLAHGVDRGLDPDEVLRQATAGNPR